MTIDEMKKEFIKAFKDYFENKEVPILMNSYDRHFKEHLYIVDKLNITPSLFYTKINDHLIKTNKHPTIHLYNEKTITKILKKDNTPIKSKLINTDITIDKLNAIKKRFMFIWNTNNIFRTHVFLYKSFTKKFLLQDNQFMELYNNGYDFQGFRQDIEDYIK
jgi:hypothetical protein